jgi:prophage DNA circulation protein
MKWTDHLRRASFRSIPFMTESYGGEHGRRWADHEYPGRDVPYAEDMGRSQRVWRFTGYLIGDNYPMIRTLLVAACELPGPGPLVHPTIGAVLVVCRKIEHNEERDRGRYVSLQFEFAEAGQLVNPASLSLPGSILAAAALPLGQALQDSFLGDFVTAGGGPWLATAAQGQIVQLGAQLQQMRLPAPGVDQGPLNLAITSLVENSAALAINPPALALATDTAFHAFTEAGAAIPVVTSMLQFAAPTLTLSNVASVQQALALQQAAPTMPLSRLEADSRTTNVINNPGVTPVVDRRRINTVAFETYVRGLALREVGYAMPGVDFTNYDDAIALLNNTAEVFIQLETVVANLGDDETYAALANVRALITQLILSEAASLTPLVYYRVQQETPVNSLTLAWRLYQDTSRDLEVCDRTDARNPGFLPFTGRVLAPISP